MSLYTKKGDKGETSTMDKAQGRLSKDAVLVEALGSLDELNSFLGIARSFCENKEKDDFLKNIQGNIFLICSIIAGSGLKLARSETTKLERQIDKIEKRLAKISSFRYSMGTNLATHLMYARSLARRAERRIVALSKEVRVDVSILQYLNRLSDMLFMLFRETNFEAGIKEQGWTAKHGKK